MTQYKFAPVLCARFQSLVGVGHKSVPIHNSNKRLWKINLVDCQYSSFLIILIEIDINHNFPLY